MNSHLTVHDKACHMKLYASLGYIQYWLESTVGWPVSEEEWARAYDFFFADPHKDTPPTCTYL